MLIMYNNYNILHANIKYSYIINQYIINFMSTVLMYNTNLILSLTQLIKNWFYHVL